MAKTSKSAVPLVLVVVLLFIIGAFQQGEWDYGLLGMAAFFATVMFWCAFQMRTQCGVVTRAAELCRRGTRGVLFGCRDHYWDKVRIRFGIGYQPATTGPSPLSTQPVSSVNTQMASLGQPHNGSIAAGKRDTMTFYCTIVSTLATVASTVAAILTL